jgi:hypothetical protein
MMTETTAIAIRDFRFLNDFLSIRKNIEHTPPMVNEQFEAIALTGNF